MRSNMAEGPGYANPILAALTSHPEWSLSAAIRQSSECNSEGGEGILGGLAFYGVTESCPPGSSLRSTSANLIRLPNPGHGGGIDAVLLCPVDQRLGWGLHREVDYARRIDFTHWYSQRRRISVGAASHQGHTGVG